MVKGDENAEWKGSRAMEQEVADQMGNRLEMLKQTFSVGLKTEITLKDLKHHRNSESKSKSTPLWQSIY